MLTEIIIHRDTHSFVSSLTVSSFLSHVLCSPRRNVLLHHVVPLRPVGLLHCVVLLHHVILLHRIVLLDLHFGTVDLWSR